ncbi:MAG: hypothetical protein JWQ28_2822 [Pedobacter sp.]|nr:hypothetical protein [Pedobacter sp.]
MMCLMKELEQFIVPYLISQAVAIGFLFAAGKSTRLARLLFSVLFVAASALNMYLGLTSPNSYLVYAKMAVPLYRNIINGWFCHYNQFIIPVIAFGQFAIGVGMLLKGWWLKLACLGTIIFLLSIAPLMTGSAFPFSLILSWAAWLVLKKGKNDYLWQSIRPTLS